MPPQRDRSVASRWRPELDSAKSGGAWLLPSRRLSSFEGMNKISLCYDAEVVQR
ncbi:hypothetical protein [Saccharococcus caldoxylosilyticus]|uniref:hypothetical protein n=1 Tax=Saccharococcus caldoxylosilyticus TaxID=81408 RepID=UPI001FCB0D9A|nr:hypothetical protein [Parageobacillus caldoxylosilyticus]